MSRSEAQPTAPPSGARPGDAPDPGVASDEALVGRARDGDGAAFGVLVRRYLRRAMAIAWEYTGSREDAEDAVQEAFRRTLQTLQRYDPTRPFRPWFFTIVRNTALDQRERSRRWNVVALAESVPSPARTPLEDASAAQLRAHLDAALEKVSEMQRRCFRLCALEGFTSAEAGEALGIREETVRTHVFRARRALAALLTDESKEGWNA